MATVVFVNALSRFGKPMNLASTQLGSLNEAVVACSTTVSGTGQGRETGTSGTSSPAQHITFTLTLSKWLGASRRGGSFEDNELRGRH